MQSGEDAAKAGFLGAAIGLLAGIAGVVRGGTFGAMLGAAATSADKGNTDYQPEIIGDRLTPVTSAVLVVTVDIHAVRVEEHPVSLGGETVSQDIDSEMGSLTTTDENK